MISRIHSAILQGIDAIGYELGADVAHGGQHNIPICGLATPSGETVSVGAFESPQ